MTVIFHTLTLVIPRPRVNTAPYLYAPIFSPPIHHQPRQRDKKKLTLSHDLWSLIQSEIRGE